MPQRISVFGISVVIMQPPLCRARQFRRSDVLFGKLTFGRRLARRAQNWTRWPWALRNIGGLIGYSSSAAPRARGALSDARTNSRDGTWLRWRPRRRQRAD